MQRRFALIKHQHALADLTDFSVSGPVGGQVLVYNAGTGKWINSAASSVGPGTELQIYNDFVMIGDNGQNGWDLIVSGAGASAVGRAGEAGRPGIIRLTTGTTAAGFAGTAHSANAASASATGIVPGGGTITIDVAFRIGTLPVVTTNEAFPRMGIGDEITGVPQDGIYLTGIFDGSTFEIVLASRIAGVTTTTPVSTAFIPTANTWAHGRIVITSAALVEAFVNGVSLGTLTTTPTVSMIPFCQYAKNTGTTSLFMDVDVYSLRQTFSVARWSP